MSPQQKKWLSHTRDHRTGMENPHAFRKNWPKKKARANRRDRAVLRSHPPAADGLTPAALRSVTARRAIVKSYVRTLREKVIADRARRAGVVAPCAEMK